MGKMLILLLGQSPAEPIRWGLLAEGRLVEGGRLADAAGLAEIANHAHSADLVAAVLPGEQVAIRRMSAPPKAEGKFRSAAAYLLEDELAEPIDDLHIAVAMEAGEGLALGVRRSIVETWLSLFAEAGIELSLLTADYLAPLSTAKQGAAIFDGERVVVAYGGGGFAIEAAFFPEISSAIFVEHIERLTVYGDQARLRLLPQADAVDWLGLADDANLLAFYGSSFEERAPANFLQGEFRRRRSWGPALAPWRRSGALLAATLAALAVFTFADGLRAARIADRLETAAFSIHRAAFPDSAGQDPASHARRLLGAGGGGRSFLALASRFAEAVEIDNKVQIDRISFDAARGEMVVSVKSGSDLDIETLKSRLAEKGVTTRDNGGYRRSGAYWVGELATVTR
ncbi:MAG: type II secretion system protein GspL [Pseudomonadota bacterium]|nr:type II secretion system protein GspL [Pseudomonadota bacterium]